MSLPQLPQIPTDNLYKFMAIAGLSIFIVCTVIPGLWIYTTSTNMEDIGAKLRAIEIELAGLTSKGERLSTVTTEASVEEINEALKKADELDEQFKQLALRIAQVNAENSTRRTQFHILRFYMIYLLLAQFGGIFLMFRGFRLWYEKLQKYQDRIVMNQAKENT